MKYTQQQLQERYSKLPEDLKNAIFSVETADIIQKISKKYGLMVDQMGELASETGLVMLGITQPKDYIKNLSGRLGIDIDTAKKIAQEVNSEIFSPVKEHLKKIHGIEKKKSEKKPPNVQLSEITPEIPQKENLEAKLPSEAVTPFELTQKHKPQEGLKEKPSKVLMPPMAKKPEITEIPEPQKTKIPKPPTPEPAEKTVPEKTAIFPEKIQEKSFRKPSQVTEIEESKEAPLTKIEAEYKESDPYRELIE